MNEKASRESIAEPIGKKGAVPAKEEAGTTKYLIHAKMETTGVIERPDVVGAIFGQTEGLLGAELDLRELLRSSKIGRIKVEINSAQGKSAGTIVVPSSLDRVETAILAAALESVERVGPCEAKIKVESIEDVRDAKRKFIVDRAREILTILEREAPETQEISERVKEGARLEEIVGYEGLPAGPGVPGSDAMIIVEGRADVLNLLRAGIRNVIAIEGMGTPKAVTDLCKDKTATAFLDSDRGGDLVLKGLLQVADIDYVARPPPNRSVEELTRKEVIRALRNKVPIDQLVEHPRLQGPPEPMEDVRGLSKLGTLLEGLQGTLKANLLNDSFETIGETEVRDLRERLIREAGVVAVVFDGIITQELADLAAQRGIGYLVGMRSRVERMPKDLRILTLEELRRPKRP